MVIPLLAGVAVSIAAPLIVEGIFALHDYLKGDQTDEDAMVDEIENNPDQYTETIKALENQKVTREIVQYYHVPQEVIDELRSRMSEINNLMNKADVRAAEAETKKEKSIQGYQAQVTGGQKAHMAKAAGEYLQDERTAKKQKQQLTEEYNSVGDQLSKLTDIQNKPVSDLNDVEVGKAAADMGIAITKQDVVNKQVVEKDKAAQSMANDLRLQQLTDIVSGKNDGQKK